MCHILFGGMIHGNVLCVLRFVTPMYPEECKDDMEYIEENDCVELQWPKELDREEYVFVCVLVVCPYISV